MSLDRSQSTSIPKFLGNQGGTMCALPLIASHFRGPTASYPTDRVGNLTPCEMLRRERARFVLEAKGVAA